MRVSAQGDSLCGLNGNNIDRGSAANHVLYRDFGRALVLWLILSALEPGLDVFTCLSG